MQPAALCRCLPPQSTVCIFIRCYKILQGFAAVSSLSFDFPATSQHVEETWLLIRCLGPSWTQYGWHVHGTDSTFRVAVTTFPRRQQRQAETSATGRYLPQGCSAYRTCVHKAFQALLRTVALSCFIRSCLIMLYLALSNLMVPMMRFSQIKLGWRVVRCCRFVFDAGQPLWVEHGWLNHSLCGPRTASYFPPSNGRAWGRTRDVRYALQVKHLEPYLMDFNGLRQARRAIDRWPQGSLMCTPGGSRRENQKRRGRGGGRSRRRRRRKKKKGRRRQSGKTEAACIASACRSNLLTI